MATLGPNTGTKVQILKLINAGVDVFRINMAHGNTETNGLMIKNYKEACLEAKKICALLMDTKGPDIRTGPLSQAFQAGARLEAGKEFTFYNNYLLGDDTKISLNFWDFPSIVKPGDRIFVDYGSIAFTVKEIKKNCVLTVIENNGVIKENKTVDLIGHHLDLPFLSYQDTKDIAYAIENGVNFLCLSQVSVPENVMEVRNLPSVVDSGVKLLIKVETVECLENFDEILSVCDGVVICRSDLAVELPIEKVPQVQKLLIRKCNLAGKSVIVANQVLNSMEFNPRPTRAEATDVANILLDGADCCSLTNACADGKFPVESVKTLENIFLEIEPQIPYRQLYKSLRKPERGFGASITIQESVCSSAVKTCWDLEAVLIVCFTLTGSTARFLSKYKPHSPIIAVTSSEQTARQLMINRAVLPLLVPSLEDVDALTTVAVNYAKSLKLVKAGERVVTLTGHLANEMKVIDVV